MATAPHSLNPRFEPSAVETCVDDEISCEIVESVSSEEMVSSWTGISGVPGLGKDYCITWIPHLKSIKNQLNGIYLIVVKS